MEGAWPGEWVDIGMVPGWEAREREWLLSRFRDNVGLSLVSPFISPGCSGPLQCHSPGTAPRRGPTREGCGRNGSKARPARAESGAWGSVLEALGSPGGL